MIKRELPILVVNRTRRAKWLPATKVFAVIKSIPPDEEVVEIEREGDSPFLDKLVRCFQATDIEEVIPEEMDGDQSKVVDVGLTKLECETEILRMKTVNPWLADVTVPERIPGIPLEGQEAELENARIRLETYKVFLNEEAAFQKSTYDIGLAVGEEFQINMTDRTPIATTQYRLGPEDQQIIDAQVLDMEKAGIIEKSTSAWNAPVLLVAKDGGKAKRMVIDLRKPNENTIFEPCPLQTMEEMVERLGQGKIFGTLDISAAFWNLMLRESDRDVTSFTAVGRKWRFRRLPFGQKNALFGFSRFLSKILYQVQEGKVLQYVDDLILVNKTPREHLDTLREVVAVIRKSGLRFKPSKVHVFQTKVKFLGTTVTSEGITPGPDKLVGILKAKKPRTQRQLKGFVQRVNFWNKYVEKGLEVMGPLFELLRKDERWNWGQHQNVAFNRLRRAVAVTPILRHWNPQKPAILFSDASEQGWGAALCQANAKGNLYAIQFLSHKWNRFERNMPIFDKELAGLVRGFDSLEHYLKSAQKITVFGDCSALYHVLNCKGRPDARHVRWLTRLGVYNIEMRHIPSRSSTVASYLEESLKDEKFQLPLANNRVVMFPKVETDQWQKEQWVSEVKRCLGVDLSPGDRPLWDRKPIFDDQFDNEVIGYELTNPIQLRNVLTLCEQLSLVFTGTIDHHEIVRGRLKAYIRKNREWLE